MAMLALYVEEVHLDVGILATSALCRIGTYTQGLVPEGAYGDVVDNFTSNRAGEAANATVDIGDDC
jgi:hypothetical protein